MSERPAVFIGSSVEGLNIAYAVQEELEFDCEATVWPQGVFQPSRAALTDLYEFTRKAEFAIFVFTPDDDAQMRGQTVRVARDNVIFELGLFVGALGPNRCFFLVPHETDLHLPSDLIGVAPLRYVPNRKDGNLRAALGPACNRIRGALRTAPATPAPAASDPAASLPTPSERAIGMAKEWNSEPLLSARARLRAGIPFSFVDDDDGEATDALASVYSFLNSMADGVLTGTVDGEIARDVFGSAAPEVWSRASTFFVPPSADAAEAWNPLPAIAVLTAKWNMK